MRQWHLIYTSPKKETLVSGQLETRDMEVFFPCLRIDRGYGRGERLEPYFPHYLFVRADLMSPLAADLNFLPGVRSIVRIDNHPAVIPDSVIDDMQKRLAPLLHKKVSKAELLFRPGQPVIVSDGPFEGHDGIFQKGLSGGQRVQVLLDLVGSWTRAEMSVNHIRPLNDKH